MAKLGTLLRITHAHGIARRYFVTNGFDGALTMLGLIAGFYLSERVDLRVVLTACISAAIALGMSGLSSAYISESAERKKALRELEDAMIVDLEETTHGKATTWVPFLIASVNGLAPLLVSLLIITPIWLATLGLQLPLPPLQLSIGLALLLIFFLGVFLGTISQTFWLWSGVRTLAIAAITTALIFVLASP